MKKIILFTAMLAFQTTLVCIGQNVSNGLLGYFPFTGKTTDSTGNYNAMTASNLTLTTDKNGKANAAYRFNGTTSRLYSPITGSGINPATLPGISFSMWIKPLGYTAVDGRLLNYNITNPAYVYDFNIASNLRTEVGKLNYLNYDSYANTNRDTYYSASQIPLNTWTHVVFTIDNTANTTKIFINGSLSNSSSALVYAPTLSGISIGNHLVNNWGFNGDMDEIRIYGRAITASEIDLLYRNYDSFPPACSSTNGLVLYYPFSGNTLDSTANALNGTASGVNLTTDKSSQSNSAYSFSGNSHIKTNHNAKIAPTNGITLSAWVNPSQISNGVNSSTSYRLIDKVSVAGSQGYLLDVLASRTAPTKFRFVGATPTTWQSSNYNVIANTWQHVAVTYDNDSVRFYINGMKDIAIKGTQSLQTNTLPLLIGMDQNGGSTYLGKLDEVKIFDRALNACEIQQIYNAPLPKGPVTTEQEEAITLSNELTVFPNPSQGTFAIRSTSNTIEKLQIISLNGQLVSTAEGTKEVNVANLQPGMYFVKCWMTGSGQALIKKIIVE